MEWEKFKRTYKREGIVLVLGAGVSMSSGIPSWKRLLDRLVMKMEGGGKGVSDALEGKGMSLTVLASLLEERTKGARKAFVEKVRKALYADFPFHPGGVGKSNRRQFVNYIEKGQEGWQEDAAKAKPNHTLHSVGAFCTVWKEPQKSESPFDVNPRVRAVVTLNMDALLQSYVYARTTKHLLRTVERPTARLFPERINVYHIHGYLHFDMRHEDQSRDKPERGKQARDAPDAVVLTEQDYYDFYNNPNSLFNYTFLYLLREYSCLFIGLSMDDENIRRLLHYSKRERMLALEERKGKPIEAVKGLKKRKQYVEELRAECARHVAILGRNKSEEVDRALEATLRPLGVSVAWVDEAFKGLPKKLGSLYNAAGGKWEDVY